MICRPLCEIGARSCKREILSPWSFGFAASTVSIVGTLRDRPPVATHRGRLCNGMALVPISKITSGLTNARRERSAVSQTVRQHSRSDVCLRAAIVAILTVNDAAVQKYGYSREEFAQLSIHDIRIHSQQPDMGKLDVWQHRKKNGERIDVEVTDHELELDGRRVLIALARDVTARRRAETELKLRTTELLRVVAEGTPDAVFVKDREGRYLLFNPAAASFVGKPAAEVIGKDDTDLFPPADAAIIRSTDRRVMESARAMTSEETLTAAGVTVTYLAMKAPYRDGNGQIVGTIGISR